LTDLINEYSRQVNTESKVGNNVQIINRSCVGKSINI